MHSLDRWLPLQGVGGGASRRDTTRSTELGLWFAFLTSLPKRRVMTRLFLLCYLFLLKGIKL